MDFKFSTGYSASVYTVGDMVIFDDLDCMHTGTAEPHALEAIAYAITTGYKKVVMIGDCSETHDNDIVEAYVVAMSQPVEFMWIQSHTTGYTASVEVSVREAEVLSRVEQYKATLDAIRATNSKEAELLALYPVVRSVHSLTTPLVMPTATTNGQLGFNALFTSAVTLLSPAKIVALFNSEQSKGILLTESMEIPFTVTAKPAEHSVTVDLGDGVPQLTMNYRHDARLTPISEHLASYTGLDIPPRFKRVYDL